ncbi:MAG: hypothetical protein ACOVOX_07460 [Burkholderiaceae bacterium]
MTSIPITFETHPKQMAAKLPPAVNASFAPRGETVSGNHKPVAIATAWVSGQKAGHLSSPPMRVIWFSLSELFPKAFNCEVGAERKQHSGARTRGNASGFIGHVLQRYQHKSERQRTKRHPAINSPGSVERGGECGDRTN